MEDLIKKAKNILMSLGIQELQRIGIEREDIKQSSHSHIIVTYPPLVALPEINSSRIYSTNNLEFPKELALYLHLPFCTGKCLYCSYVSLANQKGEFVDRCLDALEKEINLLLKSRGLRNAAANSVYLGGGTPTYLSVQQLNRVLRLVRDKFRIQKEAEITVEAGPETIVAKEGEEKLRCLLENGVNRLSIGFQTFDDKILKIIGRRHNSKEALRAYKIAREVGFKSINIDLICGLPGQTLGVWRKDLEQVAKLAPESITCYPLHLQTTTSMWLAYQKEKRRFPNKEDVITMRIMATEFLGNLKYEQRPVCWFTKKPEHIYKQQIHKWAKLGQQLALGVSAYSFVNGFQYFNYRTVPQYLQALEEDELPIWRGIKLSREALMRRFIVFGLKAGLNKEFFHDKFGVNPKDVFRATWKKLEKLGLVEDDRNIIQLSYKGKLFADEVAKEFYSDKVKKILQNG